MAACRRSNPAITVVDLLAKRMAGPNAFRLQLGPASTHLVIQWNDAKAIKLRFHGRHPMLAPVTDQRTGANLRDSLKGEHKRATVKQRLKSDVVTGRSLHHNAAEHVRVNDDRIPQPHLRMAAIKASISSSSRPSIPPSKASKGSASARSSSMLADALRLLASK